MRDAGIVEQCSLCREAGFCIKRACVQLRGERDVCVPSLAGLVHECEQNRFAGAAAARTRPYRHAPDLRGVRIATVKAPSRLRLAVRVPHQRVHRIRIAAIVRVNLLFQRYALLLHENLDAQRNGRAHTHFVAGSEEFDRHNVELWPRNAPDLCQRQQRARGA
jgi:hypothetical protein